eukprot:TRINITY_DN6457_c0_g1_i1.p1 TRINITY_DN6457_c0_g1~~TRINITY_DN6457_c0_g1_i1.p1  ORF type:complete len:851 (-),score=207.52 TRINITY_DN6457_c0_g1_i1:43-2247(-)
MATLMSDTSDSQGGAVSVRAVTVCTAMLSDSAVIELRMVNTQFMGNQAGEGGAVIVIGAPMAVMLAIDCVFSANLASIGGAISSVGGSLTNNLFMLNVGYRGGAVFMQTLDGGEFSGNIFLQNTAMYGGAYFTTILPATFTNDVFQANQATLGGALFLFGGLDTEVFMRNVTMEKNMARQSGGAIFLLTGALFVNDSSSFTGNAAATGGAILVEPLATASFQHTEFVYNGVEICLDGGAIYSSGPLSLESCLFNLNTAANGAALTLDSAASTIHNCNFTQQFTSGPISVSANAVVTIVGSLFQLNSVLENPHGSAISVQSSGDLSLYNCTFISNAGVYGTVSLSDASRCVATGLTFQYNTATYGGAFYIEDTGLLLLDDSVMASNSAQRQGGAIYSSSLVSAYLTQVVMLQNRAVLGGAYSCDSLCNAYAMSECLLEDNQAVEGGAIYTFNSFVSRTVYQTNVSANSVPQVATAPYALSMQVFDAATDTPIPRGALVGNGQQLVALVMVQDMFWQPVQTIQIDATWEIIPLTSTLCSTPLAITPINGSVMIPFTAAGPSSHLLLEFGFSSNLYSNVSSAFFEANIGSCIVGTATPAASCGVCQQCNLGTYNLNGDGICLPCSEHAQCAGASVVPLTDHWVLYDGNSTAVAIRCADGMCAPGVVNVSVESPVKCTPASVQFSAYCQTDNVCKVGRQGFMCGGCLPGYGVWNDDCVGMPTHCVTAVSSWCTAVTHC